MSDVELYLLLGRAKGALEFQPVGPPRRRTTEVSYRRYAERGLEGFAGWDVKPTAAQAFVRSARRFVALERLEAAATRLEAALRGRDREAALEAGREVEGLLATLREVRPARRGRWAGRATEAAEVRP